MYFHRCRGRSCDQAPGFVWLLKSHFLHSGAGELSLLKGVYQNRSVCFGQDVLIYCCLQSLWPSGIPWRCYHCKYSCCSACLHLQLLGWGRNQSEYHKTHGWRSSELPVPQGIQTPRQLWWSQLVIIISKHLCWEQVRLANRNWLKSKQFMHLIIIVAVSGNRWGVFLLHFTSWVTETHKSPQSNQKSLSIWKFDRNVLYSRPVP